MSNHLECTQWWFYLTSSPTETWRLSAASPPYFWCKVSWIAHSMKLRPNNRKKTSSTSIWKHWTRELTSRYPISIQVNYAYSCSPFSAVSAVLWQFGVSLLIVSILAGLNMSPPSTPLLLANALNSRQNFVFKSPLNVTLWFSIFEHREYDSQLIGRTNLRNQLIRLHYFLLYCTMLSKMLKSLSSTFEITY